MDTKHKLLLERNTSTLASILNYEQISELLKLANVLSEQQIVDIDKRAASRYCKNLLLISQLQEVQSLTVFDELIRILEVTCAVEALKLLSPESLAKKQVTLGAGTGGILHTMADKPLKSHINYPLGLQTQSSPFKQQTSIPSSSSSTSSSRPQSSRHFPNAHFSTSSPRPNVSGTSSLSNVDGFSFNKPEEALRSLCLESREFENALKHYSSSDSGDEEQVEPIIAWHPYSEDAETQESGHCCLPSQIIASSDSESSTASDSLVLNPKILSESGMMALAKNSPSTMTVKQATVCHADVSEDYRMTSNPRGPCLIINNIDFESDIFPQRKGSDEDALRFDDVFKQLGFRVFMRRNLTADRMKAVCKEIASSCTKDHDALFVVLLSHGSESGIYGTDGIEVDLNDIITYFDNRNCEAMMGKPKVFVIQACRGRMIDYGVHNHDTTDAIAVPKDSLVYPSFDEQVPFSRRSEFSRKKNGSPHPVRTDMLLIFSCLAGYVSVRNELAGSWLGVALTYFIMTSAHEKDLYRILNMVSADIRDRVSVDGHTQCIEVTLLGWTKNLYFNPGIFI